ncbi:DUF3014 domain-containing protein [Ahniella affigens]|uniref:DUF3014 domain-containing protein n=1 Tax=Ahniella affigens TaxID=2021234 RepID=A0A2P1PWF2_9GAMM|nr:DUF3014 domain-containing protein [Ahniella affigens]AVP99177.1 DUF3014 domain-containing protein [Ahniella affigens]
MANQKVVIGTVLALATLGGGAGWWWTHRQPPAPPPPPTPIEQPETVNTPVPTAPKFPVDAIAQAIADPEQPLPDLFESDAYVQQALLTLLNNPDLLKLLINEHLLARFVGFVDALPGKRVPVAMWPLKPAPGKFLVDGSTDPLRVSDANFARYDLVIQTFVGLDDQATVALYLKLYPLLQQAYRELGYPDKHFNDRVVEVIDHLLATPDLPEPAALIVDDKGHYVYQDPALEAASSGHKFLWRIGPTHRGLVKTKLSALRVLLTANR